MTKRTKIIYYLLLSLIAILVALRSSTQLPSWQLIALYWSMVALQWVDKARDETTTTAL